MDKRKPEYLKLYEELRGKIVGESWHCGEKLPSRRQTALERGVSVVTVEHSYELLCQEGYVEARPRSGYYVCYRKSDSFAYPDGGPHRRSLQGGMGEEEGIPFATLARCMRRVLTDYGEQIMKKAPGQGCEELRDAIARYLERNRDVRAGADQIVIGSGSEYLYGLVVELLGRERVYAIESPSYEKIEQVYQAKGITCELLKLGRDGILSAQLAATRASVLHITPFRSFPSGVTASASKRDQYIRWANAQSRYIVEDDFESEFSLLRKPEETVYSRSTMGNVIYMNTFSRTVSPSIRVGYMVLPEPLAEVFAQKLGFYSCTVPAFEQFVLADLINGGDFERHINRVRRQKRRMSRG